MKIRRALMEELDEIMEIYDHAKQVMRASGNKDQWTDGYPPRELVSGDIADGMEYVLEKDSQILAVFFLKQGEDPTYKKIYEGAWLNDRPYAVMHRVASSGKEKGAAKVCFDWVFEKYGNVRIDTHDDNHIMQHVLEKNGFSKCGRIYLENGDPRIAYQKSQAA